MIGNSQFARVVFLQGNCRMSGQIHQLLIGTQTSIVVPSIGRE